MGSDVKVEVDCDDDSIGRERVLFVHAGLHHGRDRFASMALLPDLTAR
jgi:hypothetical protein